LVGDFNSLPGSRPHRAISRQLRDIRALLEPAKSLRTFPTSFPSFALDHIFINRALHARSAHVHRSPLARIASDHYPLVADLVLAKT
jgi:endonuclease/exonuclease/phosphatase family metal-dependent hydrolase